MTVSSVSITDGPPATWNEEELASLKAEYPELRGTLNDAVSKYNPAPGTGRTGFIPVPPNNYPFYKEDEKYVPIMQADGGQLSEWKPMYHPTAEQAEADRKHAYETGIPHGYVAPGDKYKDLPTIDLIVQSELHSEDEYGADVDANGRHHGGPFKISVSPKMRIDELRKVIYQKGGVIPALQRFSYAGKNLEDSQRTLEHYGIAYWNKKFPAWPLKIRRSSSRIPSSCITSTARTRLTRLVVHSNKGFGSQQPNKKNPEEDIPVQGTAGATPQNKRVGRNKGKQQMRVGQAAAQAAAQQRAPASLGSLTQASEPAESITNKLEFEERLKTLKEEADRKKAEIKAARGGILDNGPDYDNPPPLTSTLFMGGQENKNPAADKEYSGSSLGPSQIALGAVSLALVGVFLVANGGSELGYAAKRPSAGQQNGAQTELAPEQRADIEKQLEEMNKKLEVNENDLESLEAAAVLHARLGEYSIAAEQLEKLTAAKPNDVDSLRVLAEARAAAGEPAKATEAYRKAWKVAGQNNLEILTGFANALVEEGKPQVAVEEIQRVSKSAQAKDLGEVELGLLLAKTYSQWKGHAPDATAQYDRLIEANPQDFRPPLGKALLLRDQGQEGDAQRYILQAKYLAPSSARPLVDALTAARK